MWRHHDQPITNQLVLMSLNHVNSPDNSRLTIRCQQQSSTFKCYYIPGVYLHGVYIHGVYTHSLHPLILLYVTGITLQHGEL